jgi:Tfp pilus assembly protein FimV
MVLCRSDVRSNTRSGTPAVRQAVVEEAEMTEIPLMIPTAPAPVRLTRRGRLVLVLALAAVLFAAFSLGRVGAEGSTSAEPARPLETVTVEPGDTLWAVAKRLAPGQDPRPVVEQLRELNDLSGGGLHAGQQLVLPASR